MYSYAVLERVLATVHGIPEEARAKAFRARIGHLRKLGLPLGPPTGRGVATSYTVGQLLQFSVALELAEFSVTPAATVEAVTRHWACWDGLKDHTLGWGERDPGGPDVFAVFEPDFLGGEMKGESMTIKLVERDEVDGMVSSARRLALINISEMMRRIAAAERQLASKAGIQISEI